MDWSHRNGGWNLDAPDGKAWHGRVLGTIEAQIGEPPWGDALEIGCSEGAFTSQLASRCTGVVACDISPVAAAKARARCDPFPNTRVAVLDPTRDEIPGQYDVVVAMDVLSCIRGRKRLMAALERLVSSLRDGGILVYTDNSMPLNVLDSWGRRPWWSRPLAMVEPDDCLTLLEQSFPVRVVAREPYPEMGRDELIAILRKVPAAER